MTAQIDADALSAIRQQAWHSAYDAFATGYIFEQRRRKLGRYLRWNNFVHLCVPLAVGASALAFGVVAATWEIVIWIAGVLGVLQVLFSLWALNERWEERLSHASESASANHDLSRRFTMLAKAQTEVHELTRRLDLLAAENLQREQADYKQEITEEEKRMGHRAALRQFDKTCVKCLQTPPSMDPTECGVCGNFPKGWV
jgi:mobilome CxxCx(11)CxxC protein